MRRDSKQWWKLSKSLMCKMVSKSGIPALRRVDGTWARSSQDKCNLLAESFQQKWILPPAVRNQYSDIPSIDLIADYFIPLRTREAGRFLSSLDSTNATGHDNIGTVVLSLRLLQVYWLSHS